MSTILTVFSRLMPDDFSSVIGESFTQKEMPFCGNFGSPDIFLADEEAARLASDFDFEGAKSLAYIRCLTPIGRTMIEDFSRFVRAQLGGSPCLILLDSEFVLWQG